MKILLAYLMLLGGCQALLASDRNPTKLEKTIALKNKGIEVFLLENKLGIIRLTCKDESVSLKIYDANRKILLEKPFGNDPVEIDVKEWDEGNYRYEVIKENEIVKTGTIKVNN
jgi:hypothetical protein